MATITTIPSTFRTDSSGVLIYSNLDVTPAYDVSGAYVLNYNGQPVSDTFSVNSQLNNISGFRAIAKEYSSGYLYAANSNTSTVYKLNPDGSILNSNFISVSLPYGVAVDKSGFVYVSYHNPDSIGKYNTSDGTPVNASFVTTNLSNPQSIAIDNSFNYLYIGNNGSHTITRVNLSGTPVNSIFISTNVRFPSGLTFDSTGNLYVSNNDQLVITKISSTGTFLANITPSIPLNRANCISSYNSGYLYVGDRTQTLRVAISNGDSSIFSSNLNTTGSFIDTSGNIYLGTTSGLYKMSITHNFTFNITSISALGLTTLDIYDVNRNTVITSFDIMINEQPCFKEGTKILCFVDDVETYIPIEDIRPGMIVKTYWDGWKHPVKFVGRGKTFNSKREGDRNRLFKLSKNDCPDLIEDLYLTGTHSLLVKELTEEEKQHMDDLIWPLWLYKIYDHYKILACHYHLCEPVCDEKTETIYHIVLDDPDPYFNFAIYANGVLAESCTEWAFKELSGFEEVI